MSEKSYQAIQNYQATKERKEKQAVTKDLFDKRFIEFYRMNLDDLRLELFAEERGIPKEILKKHELGWDGFAYTLPIYHENGCLIGFRRKVPNGDTISKKGSVAGLFNVQAILGLKKGEVIYICEGEWDAMSLEAQGYKNVVAVPGAYTFMKEWIHLFLGMNVVMLYDTDETGRKQSAKAAKLLSGVAASVKNINLSILLEGGKDVRDYFRRT